MVGELGDDLGLVPSTASRLSDRLAEAGLITRRPAPSNRRSTLLELTHASSAPSPAEPATRPERRLQQGHCACERLADDYGRRVPNRLVACLLPIAVIHR